MEFILLESSDKLNELTESKKTQIIFKHNTTCPISKSVKQRLENEGEPLAGLAPFYLLDILSHRDISDAVAEKFDIPHQSPQLLVIHDGRCIYDEALYQISASEAEFAIKEAEG